MNVKIRKLHADAVVPKYATELAAGFDLVAVEDCVIEPGETVKVPLGLAFEIPAGYVMYVTMRSGIALKTKLRQSNGVGVIDADYRGEVAMMLDNIGESEKVIVTLDGKSRLVAAVTQFRRTIDGGTVKRELEFLAEGTYLIRKGDRICQAVIQRYESAEFTVVDELSDTERGAGGFGSTGTEVNE